MGLKYPCGHVNSVLHVTFGAHGLFLQYILIHVTCLLFKFNSRLTTVSSFRHWGWAEEVPSVCDPTLRGRCGEVRGLEMGPGPLEAMKGCEGRRAAAAGEVGWGGAFCSVAAPPGGHLPQGKGGVRITGMCLLNATCFPCQSGTCVLDFGPRGHGPIFTSVCYSGLSTGSGSRPAFSWRSMFLVCLLPVTSPRAKPFR